MPKSLLYSSWLFRSTSVLLGLGAGGRASGTGAVIGALGAGTEAFPAWDFFRIDGSLGFLATGSVASGSFAPLLVDAVPAPSSVSARLRFSAEVAVVDLVVRSSFATIGFSLAVVLSLAFADLIIARRATAGLREEDEGRVETAGVRSTLSTSTSSSYSLSLSSTAGVLWAEDECGASASLSSSEDTILERRTLLLLPEATGLKGAGASCERNACQLPGTIKTRCKLSCLGIRWRHAFWGRKGTTTCGCRGFSYFETKSCELARHI
jgi:hypothetical protein